MDCQTARVLLQLEHPRSTEGDAGDVEALEHHLLECRECARLAKGERTFDNRLSLAMRDVPVPPLLREKIHERLGAETLLARKGRWRKQAGYVAAAAMLLIGAWLGAAWYRHQQLARLDLAYVQQTVYAALVNPSRDSLDQWLGEQHLAVLPPEDFNYDLLAGYHLTELQGKRVAMLDFGAGKQHAHVYLLSSDQFDLAALAAGPQEYGSGCRVEVRWHPTNPQLAYLVAYTGDSLKPFLIPESKRTA